MQHVSEIVATRARLAPPAFPPPAWQRAAAAAHATARARVPDPATLPQLSRVCQLLTSHTLTERERTRALSRLGQGCSRAQASAMLDYLLPRVQARKAAEAERFLRPLLAGGAPADA